VPIKLSNTLRRRVGEWINRLVFFTSALAGDEWSASRPNRFTSVRTGYEDGICPRAGLENV
jgi:hypothetical protein